MPPASVAILIAACRAVLSVVSVVNAFNATDAHLLWNWGDIVVVDRVALPVFHAIPSRSDRLTVAVGFILDSSHGSGAYNGVPSR